MGRILVWCSKYITHLVRVINETSAPSEVIIPYKITTGGSAVPDIGCYEWHP